MKSSMENALFLDVRTEEEYLEGHFENSRLVPLATIAEADLPEDKGTPIFVHCQMGGRAEQARQILMARGYSNVVNLGGLEDVEAMGIAFTTEDNQ